MQIARDETMPMLYPSEATPPTSEERRLVCAS